MDTSAVAPNVTRKRLDWRSILFAGVAGLLGLFFLVLALSMNPWTGSVAPRPGYTPGLHIWHEAEAAALSVLYGLCLLIAIWKPRDKPLLVQFFVITMLLHMLIVNLFAGFSSDTLMYLVFIVLIIVLYPNPRALFRFDRQGSPGKLLLSLSLIAGVLLAPYFVRTLQYQLSGVGGEHYTTSHWIESFNLVITLFIALLMTSFKSTGWKALGIIAGITFLFLGAAAVSFPTSDGSWGVTGGIVSLLFGLGFITASLWEGRKLTTAV